MTDTAGLLVTGTDPELSAVAVFEPVESVALVAQPPKDEEEGGRGADFGKSSPVGLLVLLLFFIAVAFLVRSMTKHLKRVPASFDPPEESADDSTDSRASLDSRDSADSTEPEEPADSADSADSSDAADSSEERPKASPANGTSDPS